MPAPDRPAGARLRKNRPFWLATALYTLSLLTDDGKTTLPWGLTPSALAAAVVVATGLPTFKIALPRLFAVASAAFAGVCLFQVVLLDQSLSGAYRLVGPLALAWVIACSDDHPGYLRHLLRFFVLSGAILAATYYFGLWEPLLNSGGRQTYERFNPNILSAQIAAAVPMLLYLVQTGQRGWRLPLGWAVSLAMVPPVLATLSLRGLAILVLGTGMLLVLPVLRWRGRWLAVALAALAATSAALVIDDLSVVWRTLLPDVLVSRIEQPDLLRDEISAIGWRLLREEIVTGYGLDVLIDDRWRISHGFPLSGGLPVFVHNGFLAVGIAGGLLLLAPFVAIFVLLGVRLLRELLAAREGEDRGRAVMALVVLALVLIGMLSGGGSESWKAGWWMVGFALATSRHLALAAVPTGRRAQ